MLIYIELVNIDGIHVYQSRTESFVCTLKMEGLIHPSIARGVHPIWDDSQFDWKSSFFPCPLSVVVQQKRMENRSKLLVGCFTWQETLLKYHEIPRQRRMICKEKKSRAY